MTSLHKSSLQKREDLRKRVDLQKMQIMWFIHKQCCGAETFCFRSGSDFQKVSVPAPAPAPTLALYLPFNHRFHFKKWIFHVFL
jgi:hypothetical protein